MELLLVWAMIVQFLRARLLRVQIQTRTERPPQSGDQ